MLIRGNIRGGTQCDVVSRPELGLLRRPNSVIKIDNLVRSEQMRSQNSNREPSKDYLTRRDYAESPSLSLVPEQHN